MNVSPHNVVSKILHILYSHLGKYVNYYSKQQKALNLILIHIPSIIRIVFLVAGERPRIKRVILISIFILEDGLSSSN